MKSRAIEMNGVFRPLRANEKHIKVEKHISGGIEIHIGSEGCVLSPRKSFEMARAVMQALGFDFIQKVPDELPDN